MRKFKKYIPLVILALSVSACPASADAAVLRDVTTETTEATTEKTGPKEEWKTDKETGKWYYTIDEIPVTGWKKIKKKWYFFGSDTFLLTNTDIGPYHVNSDGELTNPGTEKGFKPEAHGIIYNSTSSIILKEGNDNVVKMKNDIDSLYDSFKENNSINPEDIRTLRYFYNSLTMAEKANVPNETYLAEMELANKITYDYSKIYATSTDAQSADKESKVGTDYTFEISDKKSAVSVIVRYTTDANMDGNGDKPSVLLVSPSGSSWEMEEETPQIRNDSINAALTWTDNFVQFDIVNAENGNWTIRTDINCTFKLQEYAGNMKNLNPIPAQDEVHSDTDATAEKEKDKNKKKPIAKLIIMLTAIGGFVGFMVYMSKKPVEGGNKKKKDEAQPQSSEEDLESLRQELIKMNAEFEQAEYEDDPRNTNINTQNNNITEYSQEEIIESLEDYSAGYGTDDRIYATDSSENYPVVSQPVASHNDNSYEGDEWYEEEE